MDRGFFFNIHILYILGVGGRIFNTLQCGCEAVHPEMGLGCKAILLPTVTDFSLHRSPRPPPPPAFPPGLQAELISGFQAKKMGRKKQAQRSLLGADLELPCLILAVVDSFFLKVPTPQRKVSLSHIWQRRFLKCPHSRCWLFLTSEFDTGIRLSSTKHTGPSGGRAPPSFPAPCHFINGRR